MGRFMKLISTLLLTLVLALSTTAHSSEIISDQSVYNGNDLYGLAMADSSASRILTGLEIRKGRIPDMDRSASISIEAIGNKAQNKGCCNFYSGSRKPFSWITNEYRSLAIEAPDMGDSHVSRRLIRG
jgi:hypothetical protein